MARCDPDRARRYAFLIPIVCVVVLGTGCADAERQAAVAERGAAVMPFDLDRTTHHFAKTDSGGVQTVVADDPADSTQVRLVQQHLSQEADQFRRGDFGDPTRIHGADITGLAVLRDAAGKITVRYEATFDGARLTYTTTDAAVVAALAAWFDAQVIDHGTHAAGVVRQLNVSGYAG